MRKDEEQEGGGCEGMYVKVQSLVSTISFSYLQSEIRIHNSVHFVRGLELLVSRLQNANDSAGFGRGGRGCVIVVELAAVVIKNVVFDIGHHLIITHRHPLAGERMRY